ncbi:restriction endonuclease subunit S, partial [Flavobacterium sp.]|uniref:restriction endonuclease subunit S n=1 Tax=Flavobacterium sp. TaxID=239 RepID=UPI0025C01BB2
MMVKLEDICDFLSGNAWKASRFQDSGIPIIRINNMNSNDNNFVHWNEYYDKKYIVNKGDLLLSISGTIKTFKWNGPEALLNQRILKITSKDSNKVNIDWIFYQLSYETQKISDTAKEAIIRNISINSIKNFKIDLPNINIQNKIVSVLDKANSLIH